MCNSKMSWSWGYQERILVLILPALQPFRRTLYSQNLNIQGWVIHGKERRLPHNTCSSCINMFYNFFSFSSDVIPLSLFFSINCRDSVETFMAQDGEIEDDDALTETFSEESFSELEVVMAKVSNDYKVMMSFFWPWYNDFEWFYFDLVASLWEHLWYKVLC